MKTSRRIISIASAFIGLMLFVPASSRAQMRMARAGGTHPAFRPIAVRPSPTHGLAAPRARINVAAPPKAQPTRSTGFAPPANESGNVFGAGSGETLQELLDPVPAPGFDYAHVAALDQDLGIKAVIDPETEWRLAVAERVLGDTGGLASPGYYLLDGGGEYVVSSQPTADEQPQQASQPEIIVLQPPAQKSAEESAPAATPQPSAPIPDVSNFTLVLRNGKKVQAIAFTRSGDRIVYITADGTRHTIASTDLDPAATERVNQDSGTQLTL